MFKNNLIKEENEAYLIYLEINNLDKINIDMTQENIIKNLMICYVDWSYIMMYSVFKIRKLELKLTFDIFSYLLLMTSTYLYIMSKYKKLIKKKKIS